MRFSRSTTSNPKGRNMLELLISSAKNKGTTFYTLHIANADGTPLASQGVFCDIEKDGELWLTGEEFINSAWSNATSPDRNDSNPYTFGNKATFRVAPTGTQDWSNEASL